LGSNNGAGNAQIIVGPKLIELGRHNIQLIGEVTSRDETTSVAVYVLIGEVNSPDETNSVVVYVCDI
jgi:hypothetical protein